MDQLKPIEDKLAEIFKNVPALPESTKKMLANWWQWLALIGGALQILIAVGLYTWGQNINKTADSINSYIGSFGVTQHAEKLSIFYWVSLIMLVVDGVILLMAYPGLKAKKKSGWNLLFLAALINAVYGVFSTFNGRGGAGSLVGSLVGTAVALYFLFQVREQFKTEKTSINSPAAVKK